MTSKPRNQIFCPLFTDVIHCTLRMSWAMRGFLDPRKKTKQGKARRRMLRKRLREEQENEQFDEDTALVRQIMAQQGFDARCDWIQQLVERLAECFAVEVVSFVIMDTHVHFILRNRPDCASQFTPEEAVRRWLTITRLKRRGDFDGKEPEEERIAALVKDPDKMADIRINLAHISWFMATFGEHVTRRINRETKGKVGSSWTGRYFSRVLEDDEAILACGLYVDLNATRADMVDFPEQYRYSSITLRILSYLRRRAASGLGPRDGLLGQVELLSDCRGNSSLDDGFLSEFTLDQSKSVADPSQTRSASGRRVSDKGVYCPRFEDYLALLDVVGRVARSDKPGEIPADAPSIQDRLGLNVKALIETVLDFEQLFKTSARCKAALTLDVSGAE